MTPLQTNATLTKVLRGGTTPEPGASADVGDDGDPVFEGSVRCYYQEKRERYVDASGVNRTVRRILHVDTRDPAIEWEDGDVVTFVRDRGGADVVSKVQIATAAELDEVAGSGVETTQLELEPK